MSLQYKVIGTD